LFATVSFHTSVLHLFSSCTAVAVQENLQIEAELANWWTRKT